MVKQSSKKSGSAAASDTRSLRKLQPLLLLVLVLIISLVLLIYVSYVDAQQSYSLFLLDRLNSNAELIAQSISPLLQAGLPLSQLAGFDVTTRQLIESDQIVYNASIISSEGEILFSNYKPGYELENFDDYQISSRFDRENLATDIYEFEGIYQIRVPLQARFDSPGTVLLSMPDEVVNNFVTDYIRIIVICAISVVLIYAIILLTLMRRGRFSHFAINFTYNVCFFVVAVFVIGVLIQIYSQGAREKAQGLADSLNVRISSIFDLDLDLDDFEGIDQTFTDYKIINPDIDYVSLIRDDVVVAHTNPEEIGLTYQPGSGVIEFLRDVGGGSSASIAVAIPRRLVFQRLLRNIKNFAVLFLASGFLSWLLLRILLYIYPHLLTFSKSHADPKLKESKEQIRHHALVDLALPAFFLANMVEGLHYSYLPQFFTRLAEDAGRSGGSISGVYAIFWAMYALVLIPAGRIARTVSGVRHLLVAGFTFVATSMVLVASVDSFAWMYAIRGLSGLGQGMIFIAIQSYLLQHTDISQRTEGVSIIVYGYNGGVVSGTVIGALLVSSLGTTSLLFISAFISLLMVWYSIGVIGKNVGAAEALPSDKSSDIKAKDEVRQALYTHGGSGVAVNNSFLHNLRVLILDPRFAKTILFVGLLAKAVLAGVVFLVLPQLLDRLGYRQEDIGQILMFYAVGVLLVSRLIARYTDRIGNTRRILFIGTICSAVGLFIISTAQYVEGIAIAQTIILVGGILILGLSHGFVHAPIVTHIVNTPVADILGKSVVASIYRFMERVGHVLGPLVFGQLLLNSDRGVGGILYVAIAVGVGSILFYIIPDGKGLPKAKARASS